MASAWGKFLAPVTVPTGGWTWEWSTGTDYDVTVAAGTYDTMLHVAQALEDAMKVEVALSAVNVSEAGIVSITSNGMTSVTWASIDDDFSAALGYDENETITNSGAVNATVTASSVHEDGWYPGVITYGTSRGEGLESDDSWRVVDRTGTLVAGSGNMRSIAQARRVYRRDLNYPVIGRTEALLSRKKGPKAFEDRWALKVLYWYPDRSAGTPGTYGTQGDPADYDIDSDVDYWKVKVFGKTRFRQNSRSTEFFSFRITLHAEPD